MPRFGSEATEIAAAVGMRDQHRGLAQKWREAAARATAAGDHAAARAADEEARRHLMLAAAAERTIAGVRSREQARAAVALQGYHSPSADFGL
jgi:hypothetical protein